MIWILQICKLARTFVNVLPSGSQRAYVGAELCPVNLLTSCPRGRRGKRAIIFKSTSGLSPDSYVNRLSEIDTGVRSALMISTALGVESSSIDGLNAVGERNTLLTSLASMAE